MRNYAILLILIALTGCASTQEVVNTVPNAVGTIAAAAVFGGEVSMNPNPVEYIKQDVNRKTEQSITNMILILFKTTK